MDFSKIDFSNIDFSKMGQMLGDMQKNIQSQQEEQANKIYQAKAGAGMVQVSVNGASEIVDINIDDSLLGDKSSMQILLISAINDALKMQQADTQKRAMDLLQGLKNWPITANYT